LEAKKDREILVAAKIKAIQRVSFCAKVAAPVAPKMELEPPPPKAPPTEPDFESCNKTKRIKLKATKICTTATNDSMAVLLK
jgi:hypothetical protein